MALIMNLFVYKVIFLCLVLGQFIVLASLWILVHELLYPLHVF
jgi:hypothetical protein